MLIDLSAEQISVLINGEKHSIDRFSIEKELSDLLLRLNEKHRIDQIYVVQWPGSFTVIRIWVLVINAFLMFQKSKILVYTLSKRELFKQLAIANPDVFSVKSYLFIGQKKNTREYDVPTWNITIIPRKDVSDSADGITDIKDLADRCTNLQYFLPLSLIQWILTCRVGKSTAEVLLPSLERHETNMLKAIYEIEANIS